MDTREVLEAVASGRLSPDEAARLLSQSAGTGEGQDAPPMSEPEGEPQDEPDNEFRLKITATARAVRIIGDAGVREATVQGRHRAERTGNILAVDGSAQVQSGGDGGFFFEGWGGWHRQSHQWRQFTEPLVIRVHPTVPVQVEVSAGSLTVQGVTGPLSVVIAAGAAKLDDVSGPLDVEARAGAVRISGRIESHHSRIRCEAGSVSLHLSRGSSATIRARAELGRVKLVGAPAGESVVGGYREVTVGSGTASVQIDTTMGSVEVFSDEWLATSGTGGTGAPTASTS